MKIVFFNHWHNGDVHVSRGIVRQIMTKLRKLDPAMSFSYSHRNPPNLLADIPGLLHEPTTVDKLNPHDSLVVIGDTAYINTWYDQQHQKYARRYGILTIDTLYAALDDSCKRLWNLSLQDISSDPKDFFPIIDYSKFEIDNVQAWIQANPGTKILVENGSALSGQAHNFALAPIIIGLAKSHPDKTFILSHKENNPVPTNVVYTADIIKSRGGSDLNEISFLSTQCSTIIGRASGVFTFTLTKENLFEMNKKYLCFSHLTAAQSKFWMGSIFSNKLSYSSEFFNSATADIEEVYNIIQDHL